MLDHVVCLSVSQWASCCPSVLSFQMPTLQTMSLQNNVPVYIIFVHQRYYRAHLALLRRLGLISWTGAKA
jgi:hypothetical protein